MNNLRKHVRHHAVIPCTICRGDGPNVSGALMDISLGGAGIETTARMPGLTKFELVFLLGVDSQIRLRCVAQHTREAGKRQVIHAAFDNLDGEGRLAVEALVAVLKDERLRLEGAGLPGAGPLDLRTTMLRSLARDHPPE